LGGLAGTAESGYGGRTDEAVERRMKGEVSVKAWAAPAREMSGRSFIAASSGVDLGRCGS
jgi:hypothetical protein